MRTSEPLHIAFVWHMHQPYYRSPQTGAFELPWARMHALKDYLDMVELLRDYPDLHQTFNLVPSLVEQLEHYATEDFVDIYWQHTLKPAANLDPAEQAFVVERMCERSDHPRARSHSRYLELALKREAQVGRSWATLAQAFTVDELRDLQIWFNLAWFDPQTMEAGPLAELVRKGRHFTEEDKRVLAEVQLDILARTLPGYLDATRRGQIEVSTSPYFHPILPLLVNTDMARVAASDVILPPSRFAHPEDAVRQVQSAVELHQRLFGKRPQGMWCSEQAVGEDVIPLLLEAGMSWTISDETVLARSLTGAAPSKFASPSEAGTSWDLSPSVTDSRVSSGQSATAQVAKFGPGPLPPDVLYAAYRLEREGREMAIVFRDHNLSDLIGFAYQSWVSRDAASDLIHRLKEIRRNLASATGLSIQAQAVGACSAGGRKVQVPLVTIALDGENAWEYYPRDGRDFLQYLYESLSADPEFRCVTISEHLNESPPVRSLDWLHTGSWIGGDLRTWCGDTAQNAAWDLLHRARDAVASHTSHTSHSPADSSQPISTAWRHILVAEGSDWFWWFGDHHHTDLDHVWDLNFRRHLQAAYQSLGEPVPLELYMPLLEQGPTALPALPRGPVSPVIDGVMETGPDPSIGEWALAGSLSRDLPSTMQRADGTNITRVHFGWQASRLCILIIPEKSDLLPGLEIELRVTWSEGNDDPVVRFTLEDNGQTQLSYVQGSRLGAEIEVAWKDVIEIALPLETASMADTCLSGLVLHIGRGGLIEHVFHSAGLASLGWGGE